MITPEDIYQFLAQSGARVTKYPDSFRLPQGALISVEGYINLTDVAARINRAVENQKPVVRPLDDLQRELCLKQIEVQKAMLTAVRQRQAQSFPQPIAKPTRKPGKRKR